MKLSLSHFNPLWSAPVLSLILLVQATTTSAQVTNFFEGFEGNFPLDNNWIVRDENTNGPTAFWDDVDASFGGQGTHSGSWKGYCAGIGYGGTPENPTYQNFMDVVMISRPIDLSGDAAASLSFWHKIPSIETCFAPDCRFDDCSVYIFDSLIGGFSQVWTTNLPVANWTQVTLSLDHLVGRAIRVAFAFHSDLSNVREGWYLDDIMVTGTLGPPPNDDFANAQIITGVAGITSGSNSNATKELNEPRHTGNLGGHSVWYRWTPPVSGQYFFRTGGSSFDTLLAIYTGDTVDNLTLVDQNDDVDSGDRTSWVSANFDAGTTYSIAVDGYNGAVGNVVLYWNQNLDFQAVVINFDNLAASTTVSNQYHAQGVDFRRDVGNLQGLLLPVVQAAAQAESGNQVANLAGCGNCGEFFSVQAGGVFTSFKQHMRVYAGYSPLQSGKDTAVLTLRAFDVNQQLVGQSSAGLNSGAGFQALLQVNSPMTNIASFQIAGRANFDDNKPLGIDDLSFDITPPNQPPDFGLSPATPSVEVRQGASATDVITVLRFNGSIGAVQFSASGLPAGVTASFAPNPADNSTLLTLTAAGNAAPNGNNPATVTVSATPPGPGAGPAVRTAQISLYIKGNFLVSMQGSPIIYVSACGNGTGTVAVTRDLGFSGAVTLSVSGLPNGFQAVFSPPSVDFHDGGVVNYSTLSVSSGPTLPSQNFPIQVLGDSPALPTSSTAATVITSKGRIDLFGPSIGQAPQALQPGTEVLLRGVGFCSGCKVQFGNSNAIADATFISGDGTELHVRVPRLATDGLLTVIPPGSSSFDSSSSFTVRSYRNTHAFVFVNGDDLQSRVGGYNLDEVTELFGRDETYIPNPFCPGLCPDIPNPFALIFAGVASALLQKGQCSGMALASQRLLHGDKPYGAFPLQQGAMNPSVWNLVGPDHGDISGASPELAHYVHIQHIAQFSVEYLKYYLNSALNNKAFATSASISNQIANLLLAGDHPLIAISRNPGDGHVLVAYDLEPGAGPGDYYIDIYDPNVPFNRGCNSCEDQSAHDHLLREQVSRIHVTPDNRWANDHERTYSEDKFWRGDFGSLVVAPYATYPLKPSLPGSVLGLAKMALGGAARTAQVADDSGHTLLMPDGSLNPDPATRLPDATPFAPLSALGALDGDIYLLGGAGTFTQTIRGMSSGAYTHTIFGYKFATRLLDVTAVAAVEDIVTLDTGSPTLQFQTGGANKPIRVQLLARATNGLVRVATITTTTFPAGSDRFGFDSSSQTVSYTHKGAATTCSFALAQPDQQGNPAAFISGALSIGPGETASFTPASWQDLNRTSATVTFTTSAGQSRQQLLTNPPSAVRSATGAFQGILPGHVGLRYQVQTSSDLLTWSSLIILPCVDGRLEFIDTSAAPFPHRFYRAVAQY